MSTGHAETPLGRPFRLDKDAPPPAGLELGLRTLAEFIGTAMLLIVVGSGIQAQRLSGDVGLELLENSTATGAGPG